MEAIAFNKRLILSEESGQGLTEYALIIALIAIAAVARNASSLNRRRVRIGRLGFFPGRV